MAKVVSCVRPVPHVLTKLGMVEVVSCVRSAPHVLSKFGTAKVVSSVCAKIQQVIAPYEDLTTVKRRKLQWYCLSPVHQVWPKPSSKAQWKGEEDKADRGREGKTTAEKWTGLEFVKSQRAVENRERWRKLVAKSSAVPQRPSRLRERWDESCKSSWCCVTPCAVDDLERYCTRRERWEALEVLTGPVMSYSHPTWVISFYRQLSTAILCLSCLPCRVLACPALSLVLLCRVLSCHVFAFRVFLVLPFVFFFFFFFGGGSSFFFIKFVCLALPCRLLSCLCLLCPCFLPHNVRLACFSVLFFVVVVCFFVCFCLGLSHLVLPCFTIALM